jgi:hypothetical protein
MIKTYCLFLIKVVYLHQNQIRQYDKESISYLGYTYTEFRG